jgi:MFS family permease
LAYWLYRDSGDGPRVPSSLSDLLRGMAELAVDPRLIVVSVVSMILVSVQLAMIGFIAVTAIKDAGVSATTAALAYSCAFGAATVSRLFWGWYSDRYMRGERIVILGIMCGLAGFACLGIAALRPSLAMFVVPAAIFVGFSGAGWNGIMAASLAEIGGAERAGSALGITLTVTFLQSAIIPVIFGALADRTSLEVAWVATAVLAFSGVLPVLWLRRHQRDLPSTDSAPEGA